MRDVPVQLDRSERGPLENLVVFNSLTIKFDLERFGEEFSAPVRSNGLDCAIKLVLDEVNVLCKSRSRVRFLLEEC